ncbi:hypothetical protein CONPUDRAFT_133802 [Coniophora puteana RWD-64-598 SS2]|uniref:Uncharacterized protein n=1 Tax=Coniophora puteana (strain RWD-64-598) TaxID=741705 RepID=A0A5M3N4K8_CONPW|nr:uncharacterized protein CONPUDRAFT_133802 [Coniophora puteana RWD-64-598 SS2]EIW86360.1 hypothetical protein CONPUDRAFT_133802 [Coniophora puteana RWD-64-598 SS2]
MWCTRWFLPLLLLPFPTAPPYFLLLFLFSLVLHAKPCFYCVILLAALFLSSCYWQAFPAEVSLSVPWSDNITTFGDALTATLPPEYATPSPLVRVIDRCWCDLAPGLFEPFDVKRWEMASVERAKNQIIKRARAEEDSDQTEASAPAKASASAVPSSKSKRPVLSWFGWWGGSKNASSTVSKSAEPPATNETGKDSKPPRELQAGEYDLGQFGFDLIVDTRWSRWS